ncbi:MAG: anaerobic sulfatase maturase [Polyangiales bacterium]
MPKTSGFAPFHLLAKPTGAQCNLDCKYCFFLEKEKLYPDSDFRMKDHLLEEYVRQYVESQPGPEINIAWQGGEPTLMGLEFFRRAVELARRYQRPHTKLLHSIQTNGVTLDDDWCAFFREHGFLVGLSLDGPRDIHDEYRVDKGGKPTFDKVMRGLRLLQKHHVDVNILTTVHRANGDRPLDVYRFLRDEAGAEFIQLIPIVEREGEGVTDRSVGGEQFGKFLVAIFDEWRKRDIGKVFVQMFDVTLAAYMGLPPSLCIFSETCGSALALEHNGDLYSCDHFVEPEHLIGNIRRAHMLDLATGEKQLAFGAHKRDSLPEYCRKCEVKFACNGGCPKERFIETPDGEAGLNYLCAGYKEFFRHVAGPMRFMGELLRRGRPASDLMHMRIEQAGPRPQSAVRGVVDAKAGRNDPCPCGSGKKHKKCHGA